MAFVSGTIADRLSLRAPFGVAAGFFALAFVLAASAREPSADEMDGRKPDPKAGVAQTTPQSGVRSTASQLPLVPLLVAALLWSLVVGAVYAVWGNYMVEGLGYTPAQMTRLWALASLSEFPLMMLAGWLSDRVGRLPMLSLGFLAWGTVFVGYLVAPQMPWIILIQLTRGFAYSAHTATAMTYAAEVRARSERGRISGLYGTAGALGSILGSSLGGALTEYVGFRALIGAGAGVIFAGAAYLAVATGRSFRIRSGRNPV
jgi:MFS family permease